MHPVHVTRRCAFVDNELYRYTVAPANRQVTHRKRVGRGLRHAGANHPHASQESSHICSDLRSQPRAAVDPAAAISANNDARLAGRAAQMLVSSGTCTSTIPELRMPGSLPKRAYMQFVDVLLMQVLCNVDPHCTWAVSMG